VGWWGGGGVGCGGRVWGRWVGVCGRVVGCVGVVCVGVSGGEGFPLRSNIPRSALCATLDTYNFTFLEILNCIIVGIGI
jgi:hypothetical protein